MRAFIFIFGFPITHYVATNKKNRESFKQLIRIAAEHGCGGRKHEDAASGLVTRQLRPGGKRFRSR